MRWVERSIPAPECGNDIHRLVKVLQFRQYTTKFHTEIGNYTGWSDWIDVPTVKEER